MKNISEEVWIQSDSALLHLLQIDTCHYSEWEKNYWQLQYHHAWIRAQQMVPDSSYLLDSLEQFFSIQGNPAVLGEVYYIKGTELLARQSTVLANEYFQKAKMEWEKTNISPIRQAMLQYKLGTCAHEATLYAVALDYYQKAITLWQEQLCPPRYICDAYAKMGSIYMALGDENNSERCFQQAISCSGNDSLLLYEMRFCQYYCSTDRYPDSLVISTGRYLVDSLGNRFHATTLANWFLIQNEPILAKKYLDLAQTIENPTPYDRFVIRHLWGHYLYQIGETDAAYHQMRTLGEEQYQQNITQRNHFNFELTRQIERQHQTEKEMLFKRKRQQLLWSLGLVVLMAFGVIITFVAIWRNHRLLAMQERQVLTDKHKQLLEQQAVLLKERDIALDQKARMQQELFEKNATILAQLERQLQLSKKIKETQLTESNTMTDMPQWLLKYIDFTRFSNPQNIEELKAAINVAYNDCLLHWQQKYPLLTQNDMQYLALLVLDFDSRDISLLLDKSIGAVYNRQSALKKKMNIDPNMHFHDWIRLEFGN
ncbi:MAG: hypothetical protein MJZ89_05455 [Paludibacteraceae bacterium]|nr:hypothetical protein [Paludibacteraceae bacterium]